MQRPSPARTGGVGLTGLVLWAVGPVFALPVVALAVSSFPEVAADAAFGSPMSQVVASLTLGLVVVAATVGIAGGRSTTGAAARTGVRRALAVSLWIAAGLLALLTFGFLTGGTWAVLALLLAHSALAAVAIGWLLVRSAPVGSTRMGGETR